MATVSQTATALPPTGLPSPSYVWEDAVPAGPEVRSLCSTGSSLTLRQQTRFSPLPHKRLADLSFVCPLPNRRSMTKRHQQTTKVSMHPVGLR